MTSGSCYSTFRFVSHGVADEWGATLVSLPDSMIVCDGAIVRLAHMIALYYLDPTTRFKYSEYASMSALRSRVLCLVEGYKGATYFLMSRRYAGHLPLFKPPATNRE